MTVKEVSAGGVVYRHQGPAVLILMIEDNRGRWSFPKGMVRSQEDPRDAALREIAEETGVEGEIVELLGDSRYWYRRRGTLVDKTVYFYLVRATSSDIKPQFEEVKDARWFPAGEAVRRSSFPANTALLHKAIERIDGNANDPA